MKAMVSSSILESGYDAGVELAKNGIKGLKTPAVGFLFVSEKYKYEEIASGIKSVAPSLKIAGCTSSGAVMTPDGIISSPDGFAGMLVLDDNELCVGVAASPRGTDPRATGRKVAKDALDNAGKKFAPYTFAMFATPGEEEEYLKGIQDIIGEIPMFGGTASDNNLSGNWKILCEDAAYDDGCAVIFFYTNKDIKTVLNGTYEETDNIGIITDIENNRKIKEIDNEPAINKYSVWANEEIDNLRGPNLISRGAEHPLGFKLIDSNLILVRHPLIGNEDGSISVGANIANKTAVILLNNDSDGLIGGAVHSIRRLNTDFAPAAMLLIHSSERKNFIGERIDEDFVAIKNAAGDIPFIVAFTMAEYGSEEHSGAKINNLSLSFTGFSEQ